MESERRESPEPSASALGLIASRKPCPVRQGGASDLSPQRPLYHVAPRHSRASIEQHGLDSSRDTLPGLPGTYLWETIEQARAYAAPLGDDIWIVECARIPLAFGGPWSIHPAERWTPDPIPADRLFGLAA